MKSFSKKKNSEKIPLKIKKNFPLKNKIFFEEIKIGKNPFEN